MFGKHFKGENYEIQRWLGTFIDHRIRVDG